MQGKIISKVIFSAFKVNKRRVKIHGGEIMVYSFNLYNGMAADGAYASLKKILNNPGQTPVVVCIGSDLSVGDSLGPLVGTMLKKLLAEHNIFVYGTLAKPVTAHEVGFINQFIQQSHPGKKIIAVDAAVGKAEDVGLIKISPKGVKPGSGADKKLAAVGDVSIMGIVAEKSLFNYALFSATRLNMVYRMATIIADGICDYFTDYLTNGIVTAQ